MVYKKNDSALQGLKIKPTNKLGVIITGESNSQVCGEVVQASWHLSEVHSRTVHVDEGASCTALTNTRSRTEVLRT